MLVWLWIVVLLAAAGMAALAALQPHLKAAWWVALGVGLLLPLLWAAAYPSEPRISLWPGLWHPPLSPPGNVLRPWTWAAGLVVLVVAWAGLAMTAYRLPAVPVTDPRPWAAWLMLAVLGLTALTASEGWAVALMWATVDSIILTLEWRVQRSPKARRAAAYRAGIRGLTWMVPLFIAHTPTFWTAPAWAGALLTRAGVGPRVPSSDESVFTSTGRWVWWLPWLVSWVPWLQEPRPALSMGGILVVTIIGLSAGIQALRHGDENSPMIGWMTVAGAITLLAGSQDLEAARAWWLLLTIGGLSLELLRQSPNPWLAGGLAVLFAGPALLIPFTPGAIVIAAWPWPPTVATIALAVLYTLLLATAWRHWPRQHDVLLHAPRGAQILVATGLLVLPATLWGIGLRLGWLTPPASLPGWLPWSAGLLLAALALVLARGMRALERFPVPGPPPNLTKGLRGLQHWLSQSFENLVLFVMGLLEGEGGLFWALVALAAALLGWKGG